MADKVLNVRIRNKYDSYENWAKSSLILEAGEIAVAYTTVNVDIGNGKIETHPELLMKVGDGEKTFANLPWLSAKAADVASWAKSANKPTYAATEITGIADYIAEYVEDTMGISVDTNDVFRTVKVDEYTYKLQTKGKADADTAWADVADSVIAIPNDTAAIEALEDLVGDTKVATQISNAITELDLANTYETKGEAAKVQTALGEYKTTNDEAVKANADAIDAVEATIGTVTEGKTVVEMIADAKTEATYDDTALAGRVTTVEGAITTLNGEGAGSVKKAVDDALNDFATKVSNDGVVNTYKELVDYAAANGSDMATLTGKISTLETTVGKAAEGETAATGLVKDVAELETKVGDKTVSEQITDVTNPLAERVVALEAVDHEHANKTVLDGIEAADVTAWDAKVDDVTAAADSGLKATKTGNTVAVEIDDSITWIFDCGNSGVTAE